MIPTRILIYRIGSLGDTVVALPCFHLIARAFPNAERRLLTNFPISAKAPAAATILQGTGLVHGFLRYSIGTRSPLELFNLWWNIVRFRPHLLVYLSGARGLPAARRDAAFFRLCGVRTIVGLPDTEAMQQNMPQPPGGELEPEAARLARNIASVGDARLDDPASWSLHLTPEEQARATDALQPIAGRPFIAVSLGTKLQANEWAPESWHGLLAALAERYPTHALVLAGAAPDIPLSDAAAAGWNAAAARSSAPPALNLCGQLSPRQSAAVLARAALYIGHDSGPLHLAAAMQVPCVGIFSARGFPRIWFPYGPRHKVLYHPVNCMGCNLDVCTVERKKCILSITVEEVLAAVAELRL